jgi:hypothetical protein
MEITQVIEPISKTRFTVINPRNPQHIQTIHDWSTTIVERLDAGGNVTIAFDTEGLFLGEEPNSLVCLQFGEIYNDSYDPFCALNPRRCQCPHIAPKPGFIITFPTSPDIIRAINKVFQHHRICFISFDFVCDVACLQEAGVRLNLNRLIDCQTVDSQPHGRITHLTNVKIRGLATHITRCDVTVDPLVSVAKSQGNKKPMHWDAIFYMMIHDRMPKQSLLSQLMLTYAASDIVLTGMTWSGCVQQGRADICIRNTRAKVGEFNEIQRRFGHVLAPSVVRQMEFFKSYKIQSYGTFPSNIITVNDIEAVLGQWHHSRMVLSAERILNRQQTRIPSHRHTQVNKQAHQMLSDMIDDVRRLAIPLDDHDRDDDDDGDSDDDSPH